MDDSEEEARQNFVHRIPQISGGTCCPPAVVGQRQNSIFMYYNSDSSVPIFPIHSPKTTIKVKNSKFTL